MSPKIFTVKRSEVVNNLSPLYFQSLYQMKENIIDKASYPTEKIKHSLKITRGRFGHRPRNDPRYYDGQYPFVQTGDVVKANFNGIEIQYTQTLNELGLSTSRMFKAPQLLFTIAANIGYTAILNFDSCFPDSIVALESINNDTSIEYLNVYFTLIQKHIDSLAPSTAQKNLNNEQLADIPIVIPPKDIQQKIVDIYNSAITQKQQKQQQTKELLATIDTYLLSELGITLPQKDNSLSKRIFRTKFSEVSGGRLDPKFYSTESKSIKKTVENSKYDTKALKEFIVQSVSGDWGHDENENIPNLTKCLVIRSTEFDNDYNLKLDNVRAKYRLIPNIKLEKIDLKENDLLIEKSGGSEDQPVGRVAIITKNILINGNICFSNFIHKIRVVNIDAEYLFCYLKTAHSIRLTDTMFSQTNGLQNLLLQSYFNQKIPLPPLSKQKEIAAHIKEIRNKAKQLQTEADNIMQNAKTQIEKMILGE